MVGCSLWPSTRRDLFSSGLSLSDPLTWNSPDHEHIWKRMVLVCYLHEMKWKWWWLDWHHWTSYILLAANLNIVSLQRKQRFAHPGLLLAYLQSQIPLWEVSLPHLRSCRQPSLLNLKNVVNRTHPHTLLHQNEREFRIVTTQGTESTKLSTLA